MKRNWKTTTLGLGMIFGALGTAAVALLDSDAATVVDWKVTYLAITGGVGLILAKDFNVTGIGKAP